MIDILKKAKQEANYIPPGDSSDELCRSHFKKMTKPSHKVLYLLPNLRNNDNLTHIWSRTNRFKNSCIPSSVASFNTYNKS